MSNTTFTTGNIGRGELRYTGDGKAVYNFSIADQLGYGEKQRTQWIECSLWGKRAENEALTSMLVKGNQVTVRGQIEIVSAEGQYPAKLKIPFVDDIVHITVRSNQTSNPTGGAANSGGPDIPQGDFDDVPF